MLWPAFAFFVMRVASGLACALAITPPRHVGAPFFRVHLWVVMGMYVFGAVVLATDGHSSPWPLATPWIPATLALASYIGAVLWLYQAQRAGLTLLLALALAGLLLSLSTPHPEAVPPWVAVLDGGSASLWSGIPLAAMLLGHWYLNQPGMSLSPLRRLLLFAGAAWLARLLAAALMLWFLPSSIPADMFSLGVLLLRWGAGLIIPIVLLAMTWQTLNIPNTQSATGILYACVVLILIGELAGELALANLSGV